MKKMLRKILEFIVVIVALVIAVLVAKALPVESVLRGKAGRNYTDRNRNPSYMGFRLFERQ